MRLITGATSRSNIAKLYSDTEFKSIKTICTNAMLVMIYKIQNHFCPDYLHVLLPQTVHDISRYELRNRHDFAPEHARLDCLSRSLMVKGIMLWNELPLTVRNLPSVNSFKAHF